MFAVEQCDICLKNFSLGLIFRLGIQSSYWLLPGQLHSYSAICREVLKGKITHLSMFAMHVQCASSYVCVQLLKRVTEERCFQLNPSLLFLRYLKVGDTVLPILKGCMVSFYACNACPYAAIKAGYRGTLFSVKPMFTIS